MRLCKILNALAIIVVLPVSLLAQPTTSTTGPNSAIGPAPKKPFLPNRLEVKLAKAELASNLPIDLKFKFTLPTNHHLNKEAPSRMVITSPETMLGLTSPIADLQHTATLPSTPSSSGTLEYSTMLYYCEDGNTTLCKIRGLAITQEFETSATGSGVVNAEINVPD